MYLLSSCLLLLTALIGAIPVENDIFTPGATGEAVVKAVSERLTASRVFPDDKLFLTRLAFVESGFDMKSTTGQSNYYGGLWRVDKSIYKTTKNAKLANLHTALKQVFGIDWASTTWQDLEKPFFSGLAARLYISFQTDNAGSAIPRDIPSQGDFYVKYYRPGSSAKSFVDQLSILEQNPIAAVVPTTEISKECQVEKDDRTDCGYRGIPMEKCLDRGCCWGPLSGAFWCFFPSYPSTTVAPTTASNTEISKECQLEKDDRTDCGYRGIPMEKCLDRGCCWGPLSGAFWCFFPSYPSTTVAPTTASNTEISKECQVEKDDRTDCGYRGIPMEKCLDRGCCWGPLSGAFWCFFPSSATTTTAAPTVKPTEAPGYDCDSNNPCNEENASAGKFYFPAKSISQYVQCSEWGQCYIMDCPPGLKWNPDVLNCTF